MSPELTINVTSGLPVYQQIRDQVADHVTRGSLSSGHRVPTVRRLARDLRLDTDTVSRAYGDLESDGLLVHRRRTWSVAPVTPVYAEPAGSPATEMTTVAVVSAGEPSESPASPPPAELWAPPEQRRQRIRRPASP